MGHVVARITDKREFGLTANDRAYVLSHKFGLLQRSRARRCLSEIAEPTDQVLGAVLFLSRPRDLEDLARCVNLANHDREALLHAATVKEERG